MTTDLQLLQRYARQGSEEAFAALVNQHLDLVYSAALRQVRSPQLAEEVAQSVFTDLSRNGHKLSPDTICFIAETWRRVMPGAGQKSNHGLTHLEARECFCPEGTG